MEVVVNSKKHGTFVVYIDDEDAYLLNDFKLNICKKSNAFYVRAVRKNECFSLHRLLLGNPPNVQVDHKNRNPLDNRKSNLRVATISQNSYNKYDAKKSTSGYKGVSWAKDKNMWCARITYKDKVLGTAYFKNKTNAALYYNDLAKKYFGEFAFLNKIPKKELQEVKPEKVYINGQRRSMSGYRGVYKTGNIYVAHIRENGKKKHLGCFKTDKEAAIVYNEAAKKILGDNAILNEI